MPLKKSRPSLSESVTRKEFKGAMAKIDSRFEKIDDRLEKIDSRFEKIDDRFAKIDRQFERIDDRFEKIEQRFNDMSGEFVSLTTYIDKKLAETIETAKREMGVLFEEMVHRLEVSLEFATELPPKIANHEVRILKIEEKIPIIQSAIASRK